LLPPLQAIKRTDTTKRKRKNKRKRRREDGYLPSRKGKERKGFEEPSHDTRFLGACSVLAAAGIAIRKGERKRTEGGSIG
jgi:hypothetical protein